MSLSLGIGNGLKHQRGGGEPPVITATIAPSLGTLTDGDTLSSAVTWGTYESSAGTITGTVREMSVNGASFVSYDGTTVVAFDDTYTLRETVTDSAGNERPFNAGTQTVQGIAPTAAGGIADQTFTQDEAITPLDVSADFSGTEPITYALAPSSAALPAGLSLDSGTGVISGTPTTEAAQVNIVVRGTNAYGSDDTAFGVTVEAAANNLLLDDYPGSAGAWSLRQLSSSTTNVVRIRRDSDNAEQDFSADEITNGSLETWVGAGNNGYVKTTYDQSGNGLHETNVNTSEQPIIVSNGVLITANGKPAARFDGVNDRLVSAATPSLADNINGFSIFMVTATNVIDFLVSQYNSSLGKRVFSTTQPAFSETTFSVQLQSSFSIDRTVKVLEGTQANILSGFWAGGNTKNRAGFNGAAIIEADTATPDITSVNQEIEIGSVNDGGTFTSGDFQECIIYSSDKTSDRATIEQNIADYYGVTLA